MIEIIYKEEKQEPKGNEELFCVPRNIRQIGLVGGDHRIYLEDYVYTFLGRLSEKAGQSGESQGVLAVFTGESRWAEGTAYVFIRGALELEDAEAALEHIDFTEKMWTKIHEEQQKYFPDQEIVGWFFSQPELPMEATELFTRVHLKHFAGGEKILMLMDPTEKEDAVFVYANHFMVKQEGYYLFYEKNPQMQAYMTERLQGECSETSQEVPDEAVKAFRRIIRGKSGVQEEQPEEGTGRERPSVFSYAATACLVIAVLTVGGSFYRNYREMQSLNRQADAVSSAAEDEEDPPAVETGGDGSGVLEEGGADGRGGLLNEMSDFLMDRKNDVAGILEKAGGSSEKKEDGDSENAGEKEGSGDEAGSSEGEEGSGSAKTDASRTAQVTETKTGASGTTSGSSEKTGAVGTASGSSEKTGTAGAAAGRSEKTDASGAVSGTEVKTDASQTVSGSGSGEETGVSKTAQVNGTKTDDSGTAAGSGAKTDASKTASGGGSTSVSSKDAKDSSQSGGSSGAEQTSGQQESDQSAGSVSEKEDSETSGQALEDSLYQEESDVRKARRRQALLEQESEEASGSEAHASYVIRPGDTLYEISMRKYGSMEAISEICSLNGLSPEEIIYPGQIIVLP